MSRINVAWLCHFTNSEVQNNLSLWKAKNEFAPWIPNMAKAFENSSEIELHIISPHEYLKKQTSFSLRGIKYHFIPYGMPVIGRHWPWFFRYDIYSDFSKFRQRNEAIIKSIKPDVINLIGAENAYYSSAVFDAQKHAPVLVGIQGFISEFKDVNRSTQSFTTRVKTEESIIRKFKYYYGEQDSSEYLKNYNPNHVFFKIFFPVNETLAFSIPFNGYKYDCVYFGRMSKMKGAEDFIRIIAEVQKQKPDVKAIMIGSGKISYLQYLTKKLNCEGNIEFTGFAKSQKELFEYVISSRIFIAPPHKERLSSTIREAMFLKVPIVAYATGGIPYINEHDENILLVKTGDIKAAARKTLWLLSNEKERLALARKAYKYGLNEFGLEVYRKRLVSAYKSVIKESMKNGI